MEILKREIEKSGLSRYRISQDTKIDQATLSRLMQGKTCTVETIDKLLNYFGLEITKKTKQRAKK